jgi:hypothetical protein
MAHGAVGFQFFNWFINRGAWTSGDGVFSILADSSDHVGAPAFELARMKEQSARFLRVVREGHPARRPVAILQPLSSHLNRTGADIPGMPPWISPAGTYFWTLYGTWEMAELAGHQSDFLTEEQITPETLRRYRVVLVPFCDFLPGSTTEALLQFVRAGGTLFAPAHTGLWDEYGRRNGRLQQAAGVTVARTPARDLPVGKQTWHFEWDAYTCRIAPTPGNKHYRSRLRFPPYEGGMKGGSADGSDAVAVTRLGRGKIVWSGVNLGHECYRWAEACFMHKDNEEYPVRRAAYHHYLAALWPELGLAVEEPFVRDQPEVELVPWEWQGNTYLFAINHSWQRPTAVRLGVRGPYRAVTDLLLEARIPLRQGRFATWLDAGQGRVFRLEPQK